MKKIGIYSGTFDPVHAGHVAFAREALQRGDLDKVFFLVEPRPRRKQGIKALEHRHRMVELAIRSEPNLGSIILDHQRFSVGQTWPVLQARFQDARLYFLLGDDMLRHFNDHDWPQVDEFIRAVRFIVGVRHDDLAAVRERVVLLEQTRGQRFRYRLFRASEPAVSSTTVKRQLRRGELPDGLPPAVADYIAANRLYSSVAKS